MGEPNIAKVAKDGRVNIPQDIAKSVQWLVGTKPLTAWLLLERFGRHRLISSDEANHSPELLELRTKISATATQLPHGPLSFEESERVTLTSRFIEVELHWSVNNGWRMTLPSITISLWRIQRGGGHVAILLSDGYIEIWSMQTLESAFDVPVTDLL